MTKAQRWYLINGIMAALLIAGVSGLTWAYAIWSFWIIAFFVLLVLICWTESWPDTQWDPSVPKTVDVAYDIAMTSILVGSGHVAMAIIYLLTMFALIPYINSKVKS